MKTWILAALISLSLGASAASADQDYARQEREIIASLLKSMTCKDYKKHGKYCNAEYQGTKLEFRAMQDIGVAALGSGASVTPISRKCLEICFSELVCVIANGNGTLTQNYDNDARYQGCGK